MASSGVHLHQIKAGKVRRYHNRTRRQRWLDLKTLWFNVRDLVRVGIGLLQSLALLIRLRPERIFIKGGYVGVPVGLAAWCLRIPFVIHESDSVPGLANRLLSRLTPYRISGFPLPGYVNLGNPIRIELLEAASPSRASFGIASDKPVILAVGGSLGSESLNSCVTRLAEITDRFEIIHITGDNKTAALSRPHYHQYPFLLEEMAAALQLADVVIARAGANTLAELAALRKVSLIVPHPSLSGNHQHQNALALAEHGAIVLLPQSELDPQHLADTLERLTSDSGYRTQLQERISAFARADAAERIATMVLEPYSAEGEE